MLSPVQTAQALSVQEHPDPGGATLQFGGIYQRGPILPAPGSRERQWTLRQYWHHDYNELFRSAAVGLIKRVQSTPWELTTEGEGDHWQQLLMQADFGSWDRFVSKIVKDFLRYDSGAFIELIAPGPPLDAPTGPVAGLAVLDSLRCYPTGNPTYPVIYYDLHHTMHLLHRARVVQFVDAEDSEETLRGYGESALSRAIGTVYREILTNRYVEQFIDDKPPAGFMTAGNVSKEEVENALLLTQEERSQDVPPEWGKVVRLYALQAEVKPSIEFTSFASPPEKFDYQVYTEIDVRKIAAALGIDVQEFWDLASSGSQMGTGTQSEILAQKSRGKALGRMLKGLERVINQALPVDVEFAFEYKDPQEDQEEAAKASTYATTVLSLLSSGAITPQESRQLLVNQVPAFRDALTDEQGQLQRLPDDDPKPTGQPGPDVTSDTPAAPIDLLSQVTTDQAKALDPVGAEYQRAFRSFVQVAQAQTFPVAILRSTFRADLQRYGTLAYAQGLQDGGVDPDSASAVLKAQRRRAVAEWLALQNPYINKFVEEVADQDWPVAQIDQRSTLWVNKSLRSAYFAGLHEAEAETMKGWVYDPAKDHCQTCLLLNGQVHSLRDWLKSGFTPGCTCLECGGYNCGCKFVDVEGGAVGRLPGRGVIRTVIDRFMDFLRGIGTMIRPGGETKALDPWAGIDPHTAALAHFLQRQAEG